MSVRGLWHLGSPAEVGIYSRVVAVDKVESSKLRERKGRGEERKEKKVKGENWRKEKKRVREKMPQRRERSGKGQRVQRPVPLPLGPALLSPPTRGSRVAAISLGGCRGCRGVRHRLGALPLLPCSRCLPSTPAALVCQLIRLLRDGESPGARSRAASQPVPVPPSPAPLGLSIPRRAGRCRRGVPQPRGCRAPRSCVMPPSWVSPGPSQQRGTPMLWGSGHAPSLPRSHGMGTQKSQNSFISGRERRAGEMPAGDAVVAHAPAPRQGGRTCAAQPMLPAKLLATSPGVQPALGVPNGQGQGPHGLGSHLQQRPPMSPLAENARPSCAVVHCQQWGDREGGGGRLNSLKKK